MLFTLLSNIKGMVYCCLIDENWTMVFVSQGCLELTGYESDHLLFNNSISYEELTYADDRLWVRESIELAVQNRENFELQYRIAHADGSIRWVQESGIPLFDDHGKVLALEGFIQDITAQKLNEQLALEATERYRSIFENAIEGIYQTSPSGQYLNFNPALAQIYGYDSPGDLVLGILDIQKQLYVDPNKRAEFIALMSVYGKIQNFESQVYRKNGEIIWISENAREVYDANGNLRFYEGTVEDISERKNYDQMIEYQATHDSLTGLPNRSALSDKLEKSMRWADVNSNKFAVAFIDLDQFKMINDSMGHHIGDELLISMAGRLAECVNGSDILVRVGGDEFVLVLTNVFDVEDVTVQIKTILSTVATPCFVAEREFQISCSIGISIYPDHGTDPNTLLKRADSAMYKAKALGRNNFQFYTRKLDKVLTERMEVEYRLRRAIKMDELVLHYQPKVDLKTDIIYGAEALVRWQRPGEALIPPLKFIPIAEETGQIEEIGYWILETACRKAKEFHKTLGRPITMSVNVSPRQFLKTDLVNSVKSVLEKTKLDPKYLELEITENCFIQDTPRFIKILHELKSLGVKLAIDDFGIGYSSLAYLKDFPVDRLKIDKIFVIKLEVQPTNIAILKAIISLGHGLGLKVVAEGVETPYQHAFLHHIDCDEFQGYFFSKPLSAIGFIDLLKNHQDEKGFFKANTRMTS